MGNIAALLAGVVFGVGLIVSGMSDPYKVQNFLDVLGHWDPSLMFVMGGAIAVTLPGFWWLRQHHKPLFGDTFQWPTSQVIDKKLVIGAAMFGTGWGLSGFCPGPAMVNLATGHQDVLVFVAAMLVGMWLHDRVIAR